MNVNVNVKAGRDALADGSALGAAAPAPADSPVTAGPDPGTAPGDFMALLLLLAGIGAGPGKAEPITVPSAAPGDGGTTTTVTVDAGSVMAPTPGGESAGVGGRGSALPAIFPGARGAVAGVPDPLMPLPAALATPPTAIATDAAPPPTPTPSAPGRGAATGAPVPAASIAATTATPSTGAADAVAARPAPATAPPVPPIPPIDGASSAPTTSTGPPPAPAPRAAIVATTSPQGPRPVRAVRVPHDDAPTTTSDDARGDLAQPLTTHPDAADTAAAPPSAIGLAPGPEPERPEAESHRARATGAVESAGRLPGPVDLGDGPRHLAGSSAPQPVTPPAAASTVERGVVDQVVQTARLVVAGGHTRMEIQLDPPSLGTVRVTADATREGVGLTITAARPETHALLVQALPAIQEALAQRGVGNTTVAVATFSDSSQGRRPAPRRDPERGSRNANQSAGERRQGRPSGQVTKVDLTI